MKPLILYFWTILVLSVFSYDVLPQEMLLMRSAKTLPRKGLLLWESAFFADLTGKYDFEESRFVDSKGTNYKFTSYTMLGYGILDNAEFLVQLPVHHKASTKEDETNKSTGFGDMSLQTRLLAYEGNQIWPQVNFSAMLRFPTGNDKDNPPIGDSTLDLGLSTVITKKISIFTGHVKLGYIFNGRTLESVNLGDQFLYMLKGDFIIVKGNYTWMKELTFMLGLNGNFRFEDTDTDGNHVDNSYQYRPLNIVPMIRWIPVKGLFMRPRVIIPIRPFARGGTICAIQYVLDLKYSFSFEGME